MNEIEAPTTSPTEPTSASPESPEVRRWKEIERDASADMPATRLAGISDPPCPCGSPALFVFTTKQFGNVTWCGV